MKKSLIWLLILSISLFVFSCGDDDDDDDSGTSDDDDDDNDDDDNNDDDNNDDNDDDNDDNDTVPPDPWADLNPTGYALDQLAGVSSHMSPGRGSNKREFELDRLEEAGIWRVRRDFHWHTIEPTEDNYNFTSFDEMIADTASRGLECVPIMAFGVDWAMPDGTHDSIDPAVFAEYVNTSVAHFGNAVSAYEIWNEQNTERFWKPGPNPDTFGALMAASYDAVKAANPSADVVFGGMSPLDLLLFTDGLWEFLRDIYDVHPNICQKFDVLSIHPYTFLQQTSPEWGLYLSFFEFPELVGQIAKAREILNDIGCPDKPIWFTEIGWPDLLISQANQTRYFTRSYLIAASQGIEGYFWYTFWDGSGTATPRTEDYFGLYEYYVEGQDPVQKPVYRAYKAMNELFAGLKFAKDLTEDFGQDANDYVFAFANDAQDKIIVAGWNSKANSSSAVTIDLPDDGAGWTWTLYTQTGEELNTGSGNATVDLTLDPDPVYLELVKAS